MKRLFTLCLVAFALSAQAQYQIPNSTFEGDFIQAYYKKSFIGSATTYYEPEGWHGYATIEGTLGSIGRSGAKLISTTDVRSTVLDPTSTSTKSACVKATSISGIVANGVMTTGRIYANSMTATDGANNYNYSTIGNTNTDNGNTNSKFYQTFTGHPDAMKVWVKFDAQTATQSSSYPYASVSAYLHTDGGTMYDPTVNVTNSSINVAHASNTEIANYGNWQQLNMPFVYNNTNDPAAILVTFTTNARPGAGTANDALYIDDIEMVYNSELASVTYDGESIDFSNGTPVVNKLFDEEKLSLTSNGRGASIDYSFSTETGILSITVYGENISEDATNKHDYTIQFAQVTDYHKDNISDDLFVAVNGYANDPQENVPVSIEHFTYDGSSYVNFLLENFILISGENVIFVGNIEINNLKLTSDGEWDVFSFVGTKTLKAGSSTFMYQGMPVDMEEMGEEWVGPSLGALSMTLNGKIKDNMIYVTISISLVGQSVEVTYGYDFKNYTLSSEYGTICIPTAAALPAGVKAYTCDGITGSVLNLVEVTALEAYTPYILEKTGSDDSYNILTTVKTTNETYTSGLLNGVLAPVTAPEGSYVLQNLEKIGFYKVASELTVPANRCYLTVPAGGGIKEAYYFNEDDATGIKAIDNAQQTAEGAIYNLAGQRMSKMQKGINIINGKKVLK